MKYTAPRILNVVSAVSAIHSAKQVSPISDSEPNMRTVTAYQADE